MTSTKNEVSSSPAVRTGAMKEAASAPLRLDPGDPADGSYCTWASCRVRVASGRRRVRHRQNNQGGSTLAVWAHIGKGDDAGDGKKH